MKDWHNNLIPIEKAVKKHPEFPLQRMLERVADGSLQLYYLIPPGKFASEKPEKAYDLITDDEYDPPVTVWEGRQEIPGPTALPVSNPAQLLGTALYNLVTGSEAGTLNTAIDRRDITLVDGEKILVPARWPVARNTSSEVMLTRSVLGDLFERQYPDDVVPFRFRETDDDPMSIGDLLIPKEFVKSLIAVPTGEEKVGAKEDCVGPRERNSLLNIIWALLQLAMNKSQNENANQSMIREELIELQERYGRLQGLSRTTLDDVFSKANKLNEDRKQRSNRR